MRVPPTVDAGDLYFTKDNSLLSRAIRYVSTGKMNQDVPSHCGVISCVYKLNGTLIVYGIEASYTGVREINLARYYNKSKTWIARPSPPRHIRNGMKWLETKKGELYDYGALAGILLKAMVKRLGMEKNFPNLFQHRSRFFCSELVAHYGIKTGTPLWHHKPSSTTPFDIWRSPQITFL